MKEQEERYRKWLRKFSEAQGMSEDEAEKTAIAQIVKKDMIQKDSAEIDGRI